MIVSEIILFLFTLDSNRSVMGQVLLIRTGFSSFRVVFFDYFCILSLSRQWS